MKRFPLLITLFLFSTGCGLLFNKAEDKPFAFPPITEAEESGSLPPPVCETDEDCEEGEVCNEGSCSAPTCETSEDCPKGNLCEEGICVPLTEGQCESDETCGEGKICQENECVDGCRSDADCGEGESCTESNACRFTAIPEDVCVVTFSSTLELGADSEADATDISPYCQGTDMDDDGIDHCDLICCSPEIRRGCPGEESVDPHNVTNDEFGNRRLCTEQQISERRLATTLFRALGPLKLKFDLSEGNCRVFLEATDFPNYRIGNSALEAALQINVGAGVPYPPLARMADQVAIGECHDTENGIAVDGIDLHFLVSLANNVTRCQRAQSTGDREICGNSTHFSEWFGTHSSFQSPPPVDADGNIPDLFQTLPGLSQPAFELTTGTVSASPLAGTPVGSISNSGYPFQTQPDGKSRLKLTAAWRMPRGAEMDFEAGTGPMTGPLQNAVMTAAIEAEATSLSAGRSIRTIQDLALACGSSDGPTGPGPTTVSLTASLRMEGTEESDTLPVTGDAASGFTIDVCLPGFHQGDSCRFLDPEGLPFAKEADDPQFSNTAGYFEKRGTIQLHLESTGSLDLEIPTGAEGPFLFEDDDLLNSALFALPGEVMLDILFAPDLTDGQCVTEESGIISCSQSVTISESPSIQILFHGLAKTPAPVIQLSEVGLSPPHATVTSLYPQSDETPILTYPGEFIVGYDRQCKLFRLGNSGVRPLTIQPGQIVADDANKNFRIGSLFQGRTLLASDRTWVSNRLSLSIPPTGEQDLFFCVTYGPFASQPLTGQNGEGQPIRADEATFRVSPTGLGSATVTLRGTAKRDSRATLALYIQDEPRFTRSGTCTGNCLEVAGNHLYRADRLSFSFRQDEETREIYIRNEAVPGRDNLVLSSVPTLVGANADKFTFTPDELFEEADPLLVIPAGSSARRLGTVRFDVSPSTDYRVFVAGFQLNASSGNSDTRPAIAGGDTNPGAGTSVAYNLRGANGAPSGSQDLIIHRMLAGLDERFSSSLQKSRIVSSATQGAVEVYRTRQNLPGLSLEQYREVFTIGNGITLDPEQGTASLKPVYTELDPLDSPRNASDPALLGIRLFNGPGSDPIKKEYRFQCEQEATGSSICRFLYLYAANSSIVDTAVCGTQNVLSATSTNMISPDESCMRDYFTEATDSSPQTIQGSFDPATGEISFPDLSIRLFGPASTTGDLDAHLHLALTTQCVTPEFIPDPQALSQRLVAQSTLDDRLFDPEMMDPGGRNPIELYAGGDCSHARELHGRGLTYLNASTDEYENRDVTGTLHRGSESDLPEGAITFDLAGVSMIASPVDQAARKMMYIIIKAEIREP